MVKVNETARVLRLKSETRHLLFTAPPAVKAKKHPLPKSVTQLQQRALILLSHHQALCCLCFSFVYCSFLFGVLQNSSASHFTFHQLQYLSATYFFLPSRNCLKSSIDFAAAACLKYNFKTSGSFSSETASLISSSNNIYCSSISRLAFTFLTAVCTRLIKLSSRHAISNVYRYFLPSAASMSSLTPLYSGW